MQGAHDFQAVSYQYKHTSVTVEMARQVGDYIKWAVRNGSRSCWTHEGVWEVEPLPSNRDEDFLARARYDTLDEAFKAARMGYVDMMMHSPSMPS